MNYQPSEKSQLSLWDSWVYITDNDVIHLFFLAGKAGCGWGYAGHAVSRDWLHWEELPPVKPSGEKGAWDEGPVGTGMVFRHDDGRYYMTYTVRLIHRHRYVELFIDDRLVFSTVTESVPQGGGIGCAVEDAAADFNIRQAHRLEPMKVRTLETRKR
jgi:hypothetical protein